MTILKDSLLQHYQREWQNHFDDKVSGWLPMLRRQQFDVFLSKGFPTSSDEHWKYTNITALKKQFGFSRPQQQFYKQENSAQYFLPDHYRLVFVDGFYVAELSSYPHSEKYIISNLTTAIEKHNDLVQRYLIQEKNISAFYNLNTACVQDGVFIYVPAHCKVDKPIQLIYIASSNSENSLQNIRNIVIVEQHANLTFIEEHQSVDENSYMTNVVTQIFAEQDSVIEYTKVQNQNTHSFHIANIEITQKRNSRMVARSYSLGGQLARDDMHCYLNEKGATLQLQGLYLPFKKQHIDLHTTVYHCADATFSEELFKGVIAGKSRAVFNGKICVAKNIKQAVANLQNKNLLLARDAEVNTKPELEIYSDDVKCKHGATIGQIDDEMLFYLRSRGIQKEHAYQLLLLAFVREQLNAISHQAVTEKILASIINYCEEVAP